MARLVVPVFRGDRLEHAKNGHRKVSPFIFVALLPFLVYGIIFDRFLGMAICYAVLCLGFWNAFRRYYISIEFLRDEVHFYDDHLEVHDCKGKIIKTLQYKDINAISKQTVRFVWDRYPLGEDSVSLEGMIIIYTNKAGQLYDLELVQNSALRAYAAKSLLRNPDCVAFYHSKKTWQWLLDNVPCPCFYYAKRGGIW